MISGDVGNSPKDFQLHSDIEDAKLAYQISMLPRTGAHRAEFIPTYRPNQKLPDDHFSEKTIETSSVTAMLSLPEVRAYIKTIVARLAPEMLCEMQIDLDTAGATAGGELTNAQVDRAKRKVAQFS